ncbi:YggS family pyridoxal phosphate-dependent enzyme [Candidatus Pelagibacter sp.]|nr:YggS family pyridoxal phosphate-dependent enzyme [Candidatus Pelagibacter sp.]
MINSVNNLISIQDTLKKRIKNLKQPKIIAVSKTFPIENIFPLINHGHEHYGENKVQEAIEKWTTIKQDFTNIKLHMIGKLQTNKVKYVIPLFDYIHSLDNMKLAEKISNEQIKMNKKLKIFIQINIGNEIQKNGIDIENLEKFYLTCKKDLGLDIVGLMCLPPKNNSSSDYFIKMKKILDTINEHELSMGMSNDFYDAAINGATFLRIGSKIFGERT